MRLVRWTYARPDLLAAANWFHSHMDETLAFGAFAALRLLDPLRYPTVRGLSPSGAPGRVMVAVWASA
jgi:hypothetical protein